MPGKFSLPSALFLDLWSVCDAIRTRRLPNCIQPVTTGTVPSELQVQQIACSNLANRVKSGEVMAENNGTRTTRGWYSSCKGTAICCTSELQNTAEAAGTT
jgi:hypothetical protein